MTIAIVLGTRPEIIKMAPVIRECQRRKRDFFVLHTGQHYSYEMDRVFFEQLDLPAPEHNLDVGSGSHADQTGRIMTGVEKVLVREQPEVVLVQGDTNTVLAGADAFRMAVKARQMLEQGNGWRNPFGDGKASGRILRYLSDS